MLMTKVTQKSKLRLIMIFYFDFIFYYIINLVWTIIIKTTGKKIQLVAKNSKYASSLLLVHLFHISAAVWKSNT